MMDDAARAMEAIAQQLGPPVQIWQELHRWKWRPVAFGTCRRCYWDSHTLGPDGKPWHPFCWENPTSPNRFDQWLLHQQRDREREG